MQLCSLFFAGALALVASCGCTPAGTGPDGSGLDASPGVAARSVPPNPAGQQPALVLQDSHSQQVRGLALSADGRILASSGLDGVVRVWDTTTGILLRRVGTEAIAWAIGLSADGGTLAYYAPKDWDLAIRVVDLASAAPPRVLGMGNVSFALSPDGRTAAVGGQGVTLYDATTGAEIRRVDLGLVSALAYDSAGDRLVVAMGAELAIVDARSGVVLRRWMGPATAERPAAKLAFAGESIVVRGFSNNVFVVGAKEGAPTTSLSGSFADVASSATTIATVTSKGQLDVWDAATQRLLGSVPAKAGSTVVAASADGSTLAFAADTTALERSIQIVDGRTRQVIRTMEGRTTGVTALAIAPTGTQLATGSSGGATVRWDLATGERVGASVPEEYGAVRSESYDAAGASIATAAGTYYVRVRDARTGRIVRQWNAHDSRPVNFAGFVARTSDLVTAGADGKVRQWDLAQPAEPASPAANRFTELGKPPGRLVGDAGFEVLSATLSPDGHRIALSGASGPTKAQVAVLDLASGAVRWTTLLDSLDLWHSLWIGWSGDGARVLVSSFELKPDAKAMLVKMPTLRVISSESGRIEEELRPGTAGPLAAKGAIVAIGGVHPALLGPRLSEIRRIEGVPDQQATAVEAHPTRDAFLFGGDGGAATFVSGDSARAQVLLVATADGEYVTATPEGAFRSSLDGARSVGWTFESPLEGFSFDKFAAKLGRPDLVAARLAGESVAPPPRVARPPSVRIDRAAIPRAVGETSVTIRASVASRFVQDLRVFVNGRPVLVEPVGAPTADVELRVPLVSGHNRVTLVAYGAEGFASNPLEFDVTSTAAGAARPDLWVVAVGVSRYPKLAKELQLEVADADAIAVGRALASEVGPKRPYAALHATTLTNEQASVRGIGAALDKLGAMRPDDLAVVFFAGHGVKVGDDQMAFLTTGATLTKEGAKAGGVGWAAIQAALAKARGHVLVLLDACHAGHVSTELIAPNEDLARELSAEGRSGVLVFAAARGSQLSYELGVGGGASRGLELAWSGAPPRMVASLPKGHGLFTSALLDALAGAAPDRDQSGAIEAGELIDFVTERVRGASNGMQTPWVARREMFGDFPVALAKR